MTKLTTFTPQDHFAYQGANNFEGDVPPRIYHFTDEEYEAFFDLMGIDAPEHEVIYIIHHDEGMVMGWPNGIEHVEIEWEAGITSERVEYLLESLNSHTLPLWAMSVATIRR